MSRARIAAIMIVCLLAAPANAEHDAPVWPLLVNAVPVAAAGAQAACGRQEVRAIPSSARIDTEEAPVSGSVSTRASVQCIATVPVRVTIVSSLYAQRLPDPALELVSTNTCRATVTGTAEYACATERVAFVAPARIVATAGVTYELIEAGTWSAGCRGAAASAGIYCFVAAEFRA